MLATKTFDDCTSRSIFQAVANVAGNDSAIVAQLAHHLTRNAPTIPIAASLEKCGPPKTKRGKVIYSLKFSFAERC
jgi:hypothetical protein